MKKIISLVIVSLFLFPSIAFSEQIEIDLTSLDFDSLVSLNAAVDLELLSRPESEPFIYVPGVYLVGRDIPAGNYYVAPSAPSDYSAEIIVYPDQTTFEQRPAGKYGDYISRNSMKVNDSASHVFLEDGNLLYLQSAPIKFSIREFTEDDYYKFVPAEGTYVPAGIYTVGIDIPVGRYYFYSATLDEEYVSIYDNDTESQERIEFFEPPASAEEYEIANLSDGNIVKVEADIIMKKQPALVFE